LQRQFVFNDQSYDLELGTPLEDVTYVLGRLRLLMFSLVPLVIAIACLGGAWMSRRALKPVQDVTAAAHSISIDNLSARLPVPKTGDEVARLTEVLNSMLARLDAAVQTLSQFAADASHELRTPLAVIRTTAELALRRGRTPESYRESLEAVVAEAEQMTELVEDLLMLARSDQAIAAIARTTVDLRVVLQDVCAQMEPLAEARDIRILRRFRAEDFTFVGSSPMLHRLFVLLIDNALKYSNPKGEIVVTLDQSGGDLCASVEDHGTGIAADDLEHIFKRFYRADKARSGGGHGLGLPLAQSIVQAHGARIEVISREGSGSIFRVVFPNVTPESARTIAGINGDAVPAA
jgi:heavy metal sensor kinase